MPSPMITQGHESGAFRARLGCDRIFLLRQWSLNFNQEDVGTHLPWISLSGRRCEVAVAMGIDAVSPIRRSSPKLFDAVRGLLGDWVTDNIEIRAAHGVDIVSSHPAAPPDLVVFPESTREVQGIVDLCREHRTPMIPFGAGSAVEGQVLAIRGGVCIDFSRMNKIIEIHRDDLDCTVQPGVTRTQLNDELRPWGSSARLIPARVPRSAAWSRPGRPERMRSATAQCATTLSRYRL